MVTLMLLAFAVGITIFGCHVWFFFGPQREWYFMGYEDGIKAGHADAIDEVEEALPPLRPEILLEDWGPEHGPMRWRWAVWEADRALDLLVYGETDEPGTLTPFMLGNAATRAMAEAEALAWISGSDMFTEDRVVVRV